MRHSQKSFFYAALCLLALSGCEFIRGSERLPDPVGIGRDNDDLKRSPCACLEIPQHYETWKQS